MRQRTSKLTRKPRRNPLLPKVVAEEQLARSILEQAAEAIIVCDERGGVIRASQAAQRFCEGSPLLRPFAEVFPLRAGAFHLAQVLQGETLRDVDVTLDRQGQELAGPGPPARHRPAAAERRAEAVLRRVGRGRG